MQFLVRTRRRQLALLGVGLVAGWLGSALAVAHVLTAPQGGGSRVLPELPGIRVTERWLQARDGARIPAHSFEVEARRGTAVLLHPNDGTRASMTDAARFWAGLGYSSIAVTLRAHGAAEGERNDVGWTARLDVLAAVEFAAGAQPGPVFVHGVSLGAAAACLAAPEYSEDLRGRLVGTVLESPYVDLRTAVRTRTSLFLPAILDGVAATGLALVAPVFIGDVDRIAPLEAAQHLPGRVLILSGLEDELSPALQTRRFVERLGARATLVEREAGHVAWHTADYEGSFGQDLAAWILSCR